MSAEEDDSIIVGGEDTSLVKDGLFLLHDWKASNKDLEAFAKRLVKMDPSLVVMLPNAMREESSPGQRSWFSFETSPDDNPNGWRLEWPQIAKLLNAQATFADKYNLSSNVLGGFGQGAIAAECLPGPPSKRLILSSPALEKLSFSECLIVHGIEDAFFPIKSIRNMVEEFAAANKRFKHELLEHDGGHDLDRLSNKHIGKICEFVTGRAPPQLGEEVTPVGEENPSEQLTPADHGWEMVSNQASKLKEEEMMKALKEPISVIFDDDGIRDCLWGSTDEEAKVARNSWGRGSPLVGIFHGSDIKFATNLAKAYAMEGCMVKLPSYKHKLSEISKVTAQEEYDDLEVVHGVGAGTLLAVHLAAWRAAIGKPLKALVLEAPVGCLQEIPGMRGALGSDSQDPLQQDSKIRFMMKELAKKGYLVQTFLIRGQDAVFSEQSLGRMRFIINAKKHGPVATELERSLDDHNVLVSEIVRILFQT